MSSSVISSTMFIWLVLMAMVTWSGRRVELGQHVPGVVAEPLGVRAVALGGEGDGAADLQDHVRHGLAEPAEQLVEHRQPLGALAVELADVDVQHGGAGVVAVDRGLDVLVHGQRQVLAEVVRLPLGAVRRGGDDQLLLDLGEQGVVVEVHGGVSPFGDWGSVSRRFGRSQKVGSPMMPARSILRTSGQ